MTIRLLTYMLRHILNAGSADRLIRYLVIPSFVLCSLTVVSSEYVN